MKYIDAEKLKEILLPSYEEAKKESLSATDAVKWEKVEYIFDFVFYLIDSIQQDETQIDKMLCSQVWWEEQGWIMIPPDATIEGIDSLLRQVKKKLQQEQPESSKGKFVFPKFLYARTTNNKTIDVSYAPQSLDAVEYIRNDSLQQEQDSIAERFARIVRGNLIGIDKEVQHKFEQLYFEVTGNKMYGGYND